LRIVLWLRPINARCRNHVVNGSTGRIALSRNTGMPSNATRRANSAVTSAGSMPGITLAAWARRLSVKNNSMRPPQDSITDQLRRTQPHQLAATLVGLLIYPAAAASRDMALTESARSPNATAWHCVPIADSGARWEFSKAARMSSICAHCDASGLALMRDHATARLKAATANE